MRTSSPCSSSAAQPRGEAGPSSDLDVCLVLTTDPRSTTKMARKRLDYLGELDADVQINKKRRRHIHRAIDSSGLPVRHATLHRGSPYMLQPRKDRSSFSREANHRKNLKGLETAGR